MLRISRHVTPPSLQKLGYSGCGPCRGIFGNQRVCLKIVTVLFRIGRSLIVAIPFPITENHPPCEFMASKFPKALKVMQRYVYVSDLK